MKPATRVIRAGRDAPRQGESVGGGVTFAGVYHAAGDPAEASYTYGRYHNPTWERLENALGELEGGRAVVFASGMAAIAAVFGTTLRPGDVLVMPSDGYYAARLMAQGFFADIGVEVRTAPTSGSGLSGLLDGAKLLWLETPANPCLDVCDIAILSMAAHEAGAIVAVDNTTPTVLGQAPLALGADISVASDTKSLTGHSDLILGHVAVRDEELGGKLHAWRKQMGAIPGPMEAWLAHRSLATLELRLTRQCANAQRLAEFLVTRNDVTGVRYPGLVSDPSHEIAGRQMALFGPVVSFVLDGKERAERFLAACELVYQATSFGGLCTTAERRARWGGDDVPEGFVRLSAGCEAPEDLIADIARALDHC
jgi:cystathionine gamma-lyase